MLTRNLTAQIQESDAKYDTAIFSKFKALREAATHSESELTRVRAWIEQNPPPSAVHTLATAGSLARFEASGESDLDLIVVTTDTPTSQELSHIDQWRMRLCDELRIEAPNPKGVFVEPITVKNLADTSGRAEETYQDSAKRVLLILESTPLYNDKNYSVILKTIVEKYSVDVRLDPTKNFVFLLNDTSRFFRALCVNYQYTKSEIDGVKWPLRNIKLRHSRVVLYFSMAAAIGLLSQVKDLSKIDALEALIALPPLRRLHAVFTLSGDDFEKTAEFYNEFLTALSDGNSRIELQGLEYDQRYNSETFSKLKKNSDHLSRELMRFYDARRRQWDARYFEYMIL